MSQATIEIRQRRADAQRNYEAIVSTAREAIVLQGSEIVLEEVARNAGVGIGTLYRHFPTRQDLFGAVFLDEAQELRQRGIELLDAADPFAALVEWLGLSVALGAHGHAMGAAVMNAKHTEGTEIQKACLASRDVGTALLERAQQAGAIRDNVDLGDVLRLLHGMVYANAATADPDANTREKRMFDLVVAGMRSPTI